MFFLKANWVSAGEEFKHREEVWWCSAMSGGSNRGRGCDMKDRSIFFPSLQVHITGRRHSLTSSVRRDMTRGALSIGCFSSTISRSCWLVWCMMRWALLFAVGGVSRWVGQVGCGFVGVLPYAFPGLLGLLCFRCLASIDVSGQGLFCLLCAEE